LDYAFTQNVVTVLSKPLHFTGEFSQMSFGSFSATGLKSSLELKVSLNNGLPLPFAKKLALRSNRRMIKSQIHPNRLIIVLVFAIGQANNYVQPEFTFSVDKVGRSGGEACVLGIESGNAKTYGYSPLRGSQTSLSFIPLDPIASHIVANRAEIGFGTAWGLWFVSLKNFALRLGFSLSRFPTLKFSWKIPQVAESGFKSLSRFMASCYKELGRHLWHKLFEGVVTLSLQLNVVFEVIYPSVLAEIVESICKTRQGLKQGCFVLQCGI
jgi:hypothetical protein